MFKMGRVFCVEDIVSYWKFDDSNSPLCDEVAFVEMSKVKNPTKDDGFNFAGDKYMVLDVAATSDTTVLVYVLKSERYERFVKEETSDFLDELGAKYVNYVGGFMK